MAQNLIVQAGPQAFAAIKTRGGLKPEDIDVIAGAAGGPKWLILNGLDRYVFGTWLRGRVEPLYLIGSSIGAWRFAALAQADPIRAMDRFEAVYFSQKYSARPSAAEVTGEIRRVMDEYIDDAALHEILAHPFLRLNLMSDLSRGPAAGQILQIQALGLALAALANAIDRRLLTFFFRRTLFYHPQAPPLIESAGTFPVQTVPLRRGNFKPALLASGSIPLVMTGVRNIPGADAGLYFDGGVIDYHLDLPYADNHGKVILFPHYSARIIPGWFDKKLTWRQPSEKNMSRVLLIAPSQQLVDSLPFKKIADRNDFFLFANRDDERRDYWRQVVAAGRRMADEFAELVQSGRIASVVRPLFDRN